MSKYRILLMFPEGKKVLGKEIREFLEEGLFKGEHQVSVDWVKNEQDAWESLKEPIYQLIITHMQMPADRDSPLDRQKERGLEFLKSLTGDLADIPSIVITDTVDEQLSRSVLDQVVRSGLAQEGENLFDDLERCCEKFLTEVPYSPEPAGAKPPAAMEPGAGKLVRNIANIEIQIDLTYRFGDSALGDYRIYRPENSSFPYSFDGKLCLDFDTLTKLMEKSKELEHKENWPDWRDGLREVGDDLLRQIYLAEKNEKFKNEFLETVGIVGGIENIRIRFKIGMGKKPGDIRIREDIELHQIFLEAITKPEISPVSQAEKEFLMLQAPITRRLGTSHRGNLPLFYGEAEAGPINCLIIDAPAWGRPSEKILVKKIIRKSGEDSQEEGAEPEEVIEPANLQRLRGTEAGFESESDWLETYLVDNQAAFNLGEVVKLKVRIPDGTAVKDYLDEAVKAGTTWHLVHYHGHSICDVKGVGWVFFPGEKRSAVPFRIVNFGDWLQGLKPRLTYLSSCSSSEADFVFTLANRWQIPAILGFRWEIQEVAARDYAQSFYQHFFASRSLEEAFTRARLDLYNDENYHQNRIWAAPLLVMQVR